MRNNFLLAATAAALLAGTAVGHADTLAGGPHLSERSVILSLSILVREASVAGTRVGPLTATPFAGS